MAGEVEKVVKDLGIRMKQSPRDLLSGADVNDDEVRPQIFPMKASKSFNLLQPRHTGRHIGQEQQVLLTSLASFDRYYSAGEVCQWECISGGGLWGVSGDDAGC